MTGDARTDEAVAGVCRDGWSAGVPQAMAPRHFPPTPTPWLSARCRSFGAASRQVSREVHADVGFAHAEVPKVELVLWPYSKRPQLTATSAGGGGHEEVAEAEQQPAASTSGSSSSSGGSTAAAASRDKGSSGAAAGLLPPYLTGDAAARPRRRARQADLTQLSSHVASLSLAAAAGGGRPGG